MNTRLTDEQVAKYVTWPESRGALAREVQELRGLRPKCPELRPMNNRIGPNFGKPDHRNCPANCEDGFVPLADWVKLLIETLGSGHTEHCPRYGHWRPYGTQTEANRPQRYSDPLTLRVDCADDQCRNPDHVKYEPCSHRWHVVDAVLKMAGDQ